MEATKKKHEMSKKTPAANNGTILMDFAAYEIPHVAEHSSYGSALAFRECDGTTKRVCGTNEMM